jgi:hypothetical protein
MTPCIVRGVSNFICHFAVGSECPWVGIPTLKNGCFYIWSKSPWFPKTYICLIINILMKNIILLVRELNCNFRYVWGWINIQERGHQVYLLFVGCSESTLVDFPPNNWCLYIRPSIHFHLSRTRGSFGHIQRHYFVEGNPRKGPQSNQPRGK